MTTPLKKVKLSELQSAVELRFVIIYRTPYYDEDVVAMFATQLLAERALAFMQKDLQDDEMLELCEIERES